MNFYHVVKSGVSEKHLYSLYSYYTNQFCCHILCTVFQHSFVSISFYTFVYLFLQVNVTAKHNYCMYSLVLRRCICHCGQLCQRKNLAHEATRDVLKDLIYHLIAILLDKRLSELEEGQQVARSVNVAVVRLVEKSDSTNVMRSGYGLASQYIYYQFTVICQFHCSHFEYREITDYRLLPNFGWYCNVTCDL